MYFLTEFPKFLSCISSPGLKQKSIAYSKYQALLLMNNNFLLVFSCIDNKNVKLELKVHAAYEPIICKSPEIPTTTLD